MKDAATQAEHDCALSGCLRVRETTRRTTTSKACVKPIHGSAPDRRQRHGNSQLQRLRQKSDGFILLEVIAVMYFRRIAKVVNPSDIDGLAA